MWFLLAAGVRPKETKMNLMDCICLCSEVEIVCYIETSIDIAFNPSYNFFLTITFFTFS